MTRRDAPFVVHRPSPSADRPHWGKVGIIALVGFSVGVAWPRLTGTRVAPAPPSQGAAASETAQSSAEKAPNPGLAATTTPAAVAPPVAIGRGVIARCRDLQNRQIDDCGALQFDPVAVPILRSLALCRTPKPPSGLLTLGFDVDFRRRKVRPLLGKGTTVSPDTAQALLRCAEASLETAVLGDVKHKHRRYTLYYTVGFGADQPESPVATAEPATGTARNETPASGTAVVGWDVAVLRDAPKTGAVVGRVMHGTRVKLVAKQGQWLRVRTGSLEGWAYQGSLGL